MNPQQFQKVPPDHLLPPPRGHHFLLIISTLMIMAGIFGVWYFLNPAPEPVEENIPVVKTDETADWKVYRNEEYGFEFKYPAEYSIYENSNGIKIIREEDKDIKGEPVNNLTVNILSNKENLEVLDWWNKYGPYTSVEAKKMGITPNTFSIKNQTVAGIDGIYIGGSEGVLTNYLILPYEDKILQVLVMIPEYNKILSTLKFIPSASSGQASTSTPASDIIN